MGKQETHCVPVSSGSQRRWTFHASTSLDEKSECYRSENKKHKGQIFRTCIVRFIKLSSESCSDTNKASHLSSDAGQDYHNYDKCKTAMAPGLCLEFSAVFVVLL